MVRHWDPQSLLAASNYVGTIEQRQGYKIACIEEIAYRMGYITLSELENSIQCMPNSTYQLYVKQLIQSELRKSPILV